MVDQFRVMQWSSAHKFISSVEVVSRLARSDDAMEARCKTIPVQSEKKSTLAEQII
jgi:hypothetical protein